MLRSTNIKSNLKKAILPLTDRVLAKLKTLSRVMKCLQYWKKFKCINIAKTTSLYHLPLWTSTGYIKTPRPEAMIRELSIITSLWNYKCQNKSQEMKTKLKASLSTKRIKVSKAQLMWNQISPSLKCTKSRCLVIRATEGTIRELRTSKRSWRGTDVREKISTKFAKILNSRSPLREIEIN